MASPRLLLLVFTLWLVPAAVLAQNPAIELTMTVTEDTNGMAGDECGVSDNIVVGEGVEYEVCYSVTNTGDVALNLHDLVDSELGVILDDFPFALAPAASAFLTMNVVATTDTTYNGTWTAFNAGPTDVAQSSDSASVTVLPPSISLAVTLTPDTNGMAGDECGTEANLSVPVGTDVEVCYRVTNTSQTTFALHDLVDSELGTILDDFPFELAPGTQAFLTQTVNASADITFVGTWTAFNPGPANVASDSATAFLQIEAPPPAESVPIPTLGMFSLGLLAMLLLMFGLFCRPAREAFRHNRG